MLKLTDYRHVIWDWNGTLFDDARLCLAIMNGMLTRRTLPSLSADRYELIFDFPVQGYYQRAGFDFEREPFEVLSDEFIAAYNGQVRACGLRSGARDILAAVRARGLSQSILSAMSQSTLDSLIDFFDLGAFFTSVTGLDNHHAAGKVTLGQQWLAGQSIAPDAMLFVGDTTHDVEVAQALGVDCVVIHSGHHARERLAATGVPVLASLHDLLD